MSIDLGIKINKAISVDHLLDASGRVIKELLGSKDIPPLKAEQMLKGNRQPLMSNAFSTTSGMLLIGLDGCQDCTMVNVVYYPGLPPFSNGMTTGLHANVSAARSPLGYALTACVAVALARDENSTIIDDALFWTRVREQSADDFAGRVAVKGTFDSIQEAAGEMYARMKERAD